MELGCLNSENMASTSPTSASTSSNPIKNVFNGVQSQASRWFRHISEAAEAYKTRDGKNRRTESSQPSVPTPDNDTSENSQDKTKDSDETATEAVKEPSDLLVPPSGCNSTSQDVESSPVSTSSNDNTPLPSASPQASPSTVPADSGEPHARKMANQLTSILNDSLRVTEEEAVSATSEVVPGSSPRVGRRAERLPGVPAHKLQSISTALNTHLTQLLKIIKDRDEERERLRRELQRSREQLHVMHESHRHNQLNASASPSHSRPNSLISQEGLCEPHHDSEDDAGLHRSALTGEHDEIIDVSDLGTDKHSMSEQHDDTGPDVFVDALSGEAESHLEAESELLTKAAEGLEAITSDSLTEENKINDV